ncbi:alpha-L-fucosidase 2 [Anaerocolumna jejuensis DSM 15929]|uniref:Alpha-L-fucosidase 2 n=2 Tax=Anaerocolumna TaxID=1843210 RepID=A0A1M6R0Y8_9FIRM|nr:alpha-L-fucosidase 2 [Anaerocolumna jejuensis DSM 15929]
MGAAMKEYNSDKMKLWYDSPALEWVEALPLGNGKLGAMVYGDPFQENIQVNEETVWSAGRAVEADQEVKKIMKKLQKCLLDGDLKQADLLAKDAYVGNEQGSYQTLGNILLNFGYGESRKVHTYRRELDLEAAVSKVRYTAGGASYRRESLISAADNVFAMSMTSNESLSINLEATLSRPLNCNISEGGLPFSIVMKGRCGDENSIGYCAMLKLLPVFVGWGKEGKGEYKEGKIILQNATSFTMFFTAATDYNTADPEKACLECLQKAEKKGYEAIKKEHIEEYGKLFRRMDFSLGEDKLYELLPTNERLARAADGNMDHSLVALYYQFGRYLLIASSRRDSELPANLQGIWNNRTHAPWGSRYTININTEMNYWIAEQCNLSECHEPLFRLIEKLKESGRMMARDMYGCRGFMAHHNTNIWGDASPQDNCPSATYWPMGAAWLCLHLWDRYEFTMDTGFLSKVYPTMKEACEFFVDFLVEDRQGRFITCPSLSPENTYRTPDGYQTAISAGTAMDNAILRKLFQSTIEAAGILGTDRKFTSELKEILHRIPGLKVGSNGTIMEWLEEYEETEIGHRHISQLFALYPAGEITVESTPELAEAARRTLERRLSHGGGHTGWSCAWIINMWSRLQDAQNAHKYVQTILSKSTYPNMFDAHPPFQIDGNFGAVAGITEMLLQSTQGILNILPALPKQWSEGYIKGIRARGNYEVDLEWENGQLLKAVIKSCTVKSGRKRKDKVKIKYGNREDYLITHQGEAIPVLAADGGLLEFEVIRGEEYVMVLKN